jgi:hypothetical protein
MSASILQPVGVADPALLAWRVIPPVLAGPFYVPEFTSANTAGMPLTVFRRTLLSNCDLRWLNRPEAGCPIR